MAPAPPRTLISARVAPELAERFQLAAQLNNCTVSAALRRSMEAYIAVTSNGRTAAAKESAPAADPEPLAKVADG